jgi:hypothetical protein
MCAQIVGNFPPVVGQRAAAVGRTKANEAIRAPSGALEDVTEWFG